MTLREEEDGCGKLDTFAHPHMYTLIENIFIAPPLGNYYTSFLSNSP